MVNKKKTKKTIPGSGEKSDGKKTPILTDEILPEDRVRLPPVFGVRPGVYLAALYSVFIFIVIFFLLIYPGLSNPGSLGVFTSEPSGAAVRVDGIYRGSTPCEVFISQGERSVEFVLPGFNPVTVETRIPGRVFASFFVPLRTPVMGILEPLRPLEPLVLGAADFAAWSLAGEPTVAYQIPLSLSEGAYRGGPGAADPGVKEAMNGILDAALRFASTRAALRDFLRARFLIDNGGLSPSPVTVLNSGRAMLARLSKTPGAPAALADYLPPETAALVKGSAWYAKAVSAGTERDGPETAGNSRSTGSPRSLEVGRLVFREIAEGAFIAGETVPPGISAGGFMAAVEAVPPSVWETFLSANPRWGIQNTAALREEGLVTGDYLLPFTGGPHDTGVSSISWYAAEAFCEWLTTLLPPELASSYEVRLPTGAEWEYAVTVSEEIRDTTGSLWEWCKDPYAPLDFFPATEEAIAAVGSPERSVRGGSWINQPGSLENAGSRRPGPRGSLPPGFCSPFVSFRPVIALKKGAADE
jgi:hypothetical protein